MKQAKLEKDESQISRMSDYFLHDRKIASMFKLGLILVL